MTDSASSLWGRGSAVATGSCPSRLFETPEKIQNFGHNFFQTPVHSCGSVVHWFSGCRNFLMILSEDFQELLIVYGL